MPRAGCQVRCSPLMKKTRFAEEQMVSIPREADERPVAEAAKKHGVSAQTICGWRKHFGTQIPPTSSVCDTSEHENGRLKKMVADRVGPDSRGFT